jgi:acetyl esterase/lipase
MKRLHMATALVAVPEGSTMQFGIRRPRRFGRRCVVLFVATLAVTACTGSTSPTAVPGALSTMVPAPTSAPVATPTATPAPTPAAVALTTGIEYESADPRLPSQALDVHAPTAAGPWPVVVMLHGGPGVLDRGWSAGWASLVAAEGFVVFAPTWGVTGVEAMDLPRHEQVDALFRQAACAVAFARAHAAEYGGDPSTMILLGHSAGANAAATIAFNDLAPSDGCPAGDSVGPIGSIITYEGDWLLHDPMWDQVIPHDPDVLQTVTPWKGLSAHPGIPVVMLVSEGSGGLVEVPVGDPPVDSWLTARDPVAMRTQFMTAGPDGGRINIAQTQAILHAALKAQGNPVSLTEAPGADHMTLGIDGRAALLAALREASAK